MKRLFLASMLLLGACGGSGLPGQPDPDSSSTAPVICTDIVIYGPGTDPADCLASGGKYTRMVWPQFNGTEQNVCSYCPETL